MNSPQLHSRSIDTALPEPEQQKRARGAQPRFLWIDIARCLGIILVVYGHAIRGWFPAGRPVPGWAAVQDRIIYAFHMPLFFFLAGLFVWGSLAKGRQPFLASKFWTVLYPYFLWSLIAGLIELAAARYVNTPLHPAELLLIPIQPVEQFWFLYVLFFIQLVVLLLYSSRGALAVVALASPLLYSWLQLGWAGVSLLLYLPFVAAGIFLAGRLAKLEDRAPELNKLALAVLGTAGLIAALMTRPEDKLLATLQFIATGLSGTALVIGLSMLLARTRLAPLLAQIGAASLAIYVMHTIFSAGARIATRVVGISPGDALGLLITTLAGLIFPLLAYLLALRFGLGAWLGLGQSPRPKKA